MPQELDQDVIADAIWMEIEEQKKDIQLTISKSIPQYSKEGTLWELTFEGTSDKTRLDESLEGAEAWWHEPQKGLADVLTVFPEEDQVILRFATSTPPGKNQKIILYPQCFLKPLKEAWENSSWFKEIEKSYNLLNSSIKPIYSDCFSRIIDTKRLNWLREAQKEGFNLLKYPFGFLWGPPGTGKTTTLGVILSEYLLAFPECKILLISSTNVALDVAITSVDEALERSEKYISEASYIRRNYIKRIGTHFKPEYYKERKHLLPATDKELLKVLIQHESKRPDIKDYMLYAEWKIEKERLQLLLRQKLREVIIASRLCAITSTRASFEMDLLREFQPFDLIVFDEASQMGQVHALALCPLAKQVAFAGDPKQLSPIVQSSHPDAKEWLGKSMFKYMQKTTGSTVMLKEQSRMIEPICKVVSNIFYDGELIVAKDKIANPDWIRERSLINGVGLIPVEKEGCWSQKYGGSIRWESAEIIAYIVDVILKKGINGKEVAVLTPFRAQRRLLREKMRMRGIQNVLVSTVHRVQGNERLVVIFDPISGSSNFLMDEDGKRLINVAISRAKASLIILLSEGDKGNEILKQIAYILELSKEKNNIPIPYESIYLKSDFPDAYIGKVIKHSNCIGKLIGLENDGKNSKIIIRDAESGKERKFLLQREVKTEKPVGNNIQTKPNYEDFVRTLIAAYREQGHKGIHSSVFNESFKSCFKGENPIEVTRKLAEEGKIVTRPARGGVMLYLPEDAPAKRFNAAEVLKKIGL